MLKKKILKFNKIIIPALTFFSLTLVFVAGFFSSNTKIEKVAAYAAEVTKNNTTGKQFCCLTAENSFASGSIPDAESEFRNLYGSFAQRKISFASVVNPDKEHSITIGNSLTPNLSALYVGPVGSTIYKDSDNVEHIKHYIYPVDLMFEDNKDYEKEAVSNYYAYISQGHADIILDSYFHEEKLPDGHYSIDSYRKILLKANIPFRIDDKFFNVSVLNIFYEMNYYYSGLSEVVGDFIMISYSFPNNLAKERKNLYFLNDNSYQNEYYMKYINAVYNSDNYTIRVNHYNLIDRVDDEYLLSFYNFSGGTNADWITIILCTFSAIVLIVCLSFIFYIKTKYKRIDLLSKVIFIFSAFVPYLFFKLLFNLTRDVMFLSEVSAKTNTIFIIVYIVAIIIIGSVIRPLKTKLLKGFTADYYEVSV